MSASGEAERRWIHVAVVRDPPMRWWRGVISARVAFLGSEWRFLVPEWRFGFHNATPETLTLQGFGR